MDSPMGLLPDGRVNWLRSGSSVLALSPLGQRRLGRVLRPAMAWAMANGVRFISIHRRSGEGRRHFPPLNLSGSGPMAATERAAIPFAQALGVEVALMIGPGESSDYGTVPGVRVIEVDPLVALRAPPPKLAASGRSLAGDLGARGAARATLEDLLEGTAVLGPTLHDLSQALRQGKLGALQERVALQLALSTGPLEAAERSEVVAGLRELSRSWDRHSALQVWEYEEFTEFLSGRNPLPMAIALQAGPSERGSIAGSGNAPGLLARASLGTLLGDEARQLTSGPTLLHVDLSEMDASWMHSALQECSKRGWTVIATVEAHAEGRERWGAEAWDRLTGAFDAHLFFPGLTRGSDAAAYDAALRGLGKPDPAIPTPKRRQDLRWMQGLAGEQAVLLSREQALDLAMPELSEVSVPAPIQQPQEKHGEVQHETKQMPNPWRAAWQIAERSWQHQVEEG